MSLLEWFLIAVCVGLIACPPRYDPAVRFKEKLDRMKAENES